MSLPYSQLDALTNKYIEKKVVNNVYNESAFLAFLKSKGRIKMVDGGSKITRPIISAKSSQAGAFRGSETISVVEEDLLSSSEWVWKQLQASLRISKRDLAINTGDAAKLSLMMERSDILKMTMEDLISTGIFGAAIHSDKQIDGLQNIVSATTTVGGIAVADMSDWAAYVSSNSSVNRNVTLPLIQAMIGNCSYGSIRPDVAVGNVDMYNSVVGLFQPYQKLGNEALGKLGFDSIEYGGVTIISDRHCEANALYFISNDYRLDVQKDNNMALTSLSNLETSSAIVKRLEWMGNATVACRRTMGLLDDIQ